MKLEAEKRKLKKFFWEIKFDCSNWYTSLPKGLDTSLVTVFLHCFSISLLTKVFLAKLITQQLQNSTLIPTLTDKHFAF